MSNVSIGVNAPVSSGSWAQSTAQTSLPSSSPRLCQDAFQHSEKMTGLVNPLTIPQPHPHATISHVAERPAPDKPTMSEPSTAEKPSSRITPDDIRPASTPATNINTTLHTSHQTECYQLEHGTTPTDNTPPSRQLGANELTFQIASANLPGTESQCNQSPTFSAYVAHPTHASPTAGASETTSSGPSQSPTARRVRSQSNRTKSGKEELTCPAGTHRASASRTKTPMGEFENNASEMELRQQDQLHAEEVFARMKAERRLHIAKLHAIIANLQTEIQRIFEEVALRRQKVHDDLMAKWEKVLFT